MNIDYSEDNLYLHSTIKYSALIDEMNHVGIKKIISAVKIISKTAYRLS